MLLSLGSDQRIRQRNNTQSFLGRAIKIAWVVVARVESQNSLCLDPLKGEWQALNFDRYAVLVAAHGASERTSVVTGMCRFDA